MSKEKICGIYCIENLVNGKKYIGQSVDITKRWYEHRRTLKLKQHDNIYLQRAWDKYEEDNFQFYIITICEVERLDELEIYFINLFNTTNNEYGYNMTLGGDGTFGYKHTEETKRYISEIQTGRKLSEEHINSIKNAWKNKIESGYRPKTEHLLEYNINQGKKIDCYDANSGVFLCTFSGIQTASRKLNLEATNICKVLLGHHKRCKNYYFTYYNNEKMCSEDVILKSGKNPIYEIDENGINIKLYPDATMCGKELGLDRSSIVAVCRGRQFSTKGHRFKYANN